MKARTKLFAALSLCVALAAACSSSKPATPSSAGGSSDSSTPASVKSNSSSSAVSPAAKASGPLVKLRLVQSSTSVGFFAFYVAREEGFFKDEGLDVGEQTVLGGDSKVAAALAGGSADIGGGVATTAFLLADGNRDPRIVANLLNSYYVDVIVGKQFKQPPAGSSLEDKIRALKGAKVGVPAPSGGGAALLQFLFNKVGFNINTDITMVNLGGSNAGALGALKTNRVDVLVFFQPVSQQVEADGLGSIYISPSRGDVPDMTDQPHGVALTTAAILKEKPDAIAAFVRAIARAEELIHSDPAKTLELFKKYQPSLEQKTVDALMPVLEKEIPTTPALTEDGYAKTLKFHQVAGLAKNAPDYATMSGDDFADKALRK